MNRKLLIWLYDRGKRDFSGTRIENADFQRSSLPFICFNRSQLQQADFRQSLLMGADFVHAHLQSAQFTDANCLGGNFLAANLRRANFSRATLSGAVFNGANLSQANLSEAALTGSELRAVNLQGADLRQANLQGANLRAANLYRADLTGADLEGADLSGAIMPDAEPEEMPITETLYKPSPPARPHLAALDALGNSPWSGEGEQIFEAIAVVEDSQSKSATQKAMESEWGVLTSLEGDSTTSDFGNAAQHSIERWHSLLQEGLNRAFQFKNQEEAQGRLNRSLLLRKGQPQRRMKLLQAYDRRCAVSRCTVEDVLELAYIVPYLGDQTHDPANLLLLRSDLHVLFDLHLMTIDPADFTVRLAPWLQESYYTILAGRSLHLPLKEEMRPSPELLRRHWEQCSEKWAEEGAWPTHHML